MNKLAIPAILAATVLVAGIFAFMPVENASTVHTTIQASTVDVIRETQTETLVDDGVANTHTVTLTFTGDAVVLSLRLSLPATDVADNYDVDVVTANGNTLAETNAFANPGANNAIDLDWMEIIQHPLAIDNGNTITIAFEEEDVADGADETITIDIGYLANTGASIASGIVVT